MAKQFEVTIQGGVMVIKRHKRILLYTILMLCGFMVITGITIHRARAAEDSYVWSSLPYKGTNDIFQYIYAVGGYHSVDNGAPAWGTASESDSRFFGDRMGDLVITYNDNTTDKIPLVFGYTMWWYNNWQETSAPFKGEGADTTMVKVLKDSLHLYGGFEGEDTCVFKVKVKDKPIKGIKIEDNPDENGNPIFKGVFLVNGNPGNIKSNAISFDTGKAFFDSHTIDSSNPYPDSVKGWLETINRAFNTYEEDYLNAPEFKYPSEYDGSKVYYKGDSIAEIASGVVYHNLKNLIDRTDEDGFMHTSYDGAPSWRYDGFGTWVVNANSYYDSYYSRDDGRAIMSIMSYGQLQTAARALEFGNKWMLYFPENNITFGGTDVPGHYTVVVNKPMLYSTVLVPTANWPTKYTQSMFGADYQNLGNQETDGHGLMMMANYNLWKNEGSTADWVEKNWKYINEAVEWILWCFDNPDLSFAARGLLYAESEAGMMDYTLYCNMACYLGLRGYIQMAETAGKTNVVQRWTECANNLQNAITDRLTTNQGAWISSKFGFYHDPAITMMSDFYGYDSRDMFEAWVNLSRASYKNDIAKIAKQGYYGPTGIGYDHSMITQNALLLDQMSDASKLVINLSKLSYAPRLPEPYIVPEAITSLSEKGIIRRQGDLGNLVQVAEALKCYAIVNGVSPVQNDTLKIMPRLPDGWTLDLQKYDIPHAEGKINAIVTYPENGAQTVQIAFEDNSGFDKVSFRFGPFPTTTTCAAAQINGVNISCELIESGDSKWAWVTFDQNTQANKLAVIYADTVENLPAWPTEWATHSPSETARPSEENNKFNFGYVIIGIAAVIVIAVCMTVVIIQKKGGSKNV